MSTTEDQIKKMYSSQLASQKEQLKQGYMQADAEYAAEKEKAQKVTDANLTRTAVEAQKAAVNNAELHNAYGLSSGTRAQARLAQENQLQADLTALRVQQQELDTDVERQRTLLSQQYQSAIREAQAENDLAKAQALYEEAQRQQDALLVRQQAAAAQKQEMALEAAKFMADAGDYTRLAAIYGLSPAELKALMGEPATKEPPKVEAPTPAPTTAPPTTENGTSTTNISSSGREHGGSFGSSNSKSGKTDNTKKFIASHMTQEQAQSRGITRKEWLAMMISWLDSTDFSDEEYEYLEQYYGIG